MALNILIPLFNQTTFDFHFQDAVESQRMARGQKEHLDREVRKFRRRRLIKYHDLEQDLLREVSYKPFPNDSPRTFIHVAENMSI
jgi:hypothetical protein